VIAALSAALGLGAFLIFEVLLHVARATTPVGGALHQVLHHWASGKPGSWILLALLAAALSYPLRALLALRRRDDAASATASELRILATLGAASTLVVVSGAMLRVYAAGVRALGEDALAVAVRLEQQMAAWSFLGTALSLLAVLWAVVGIGWARRESSRSAARIVTIVGSSALVLITSLALLEWWFTVANITYNEEWTMPGRRHETIVSTGDPLIHGRNALIGVAAIAAVALLVAARRGRSGRGAAREMIAGASLFALGLGAFALTRDQAYDALHPLPYWGDGVNSWLDDAAVASLPHGDTCVFGVEDFPNLALTRDGRGSFNGSPWRDVAELTKLLESLKALWIQVQPGKRFPGRFEAAIPADVAMEVVSPAFAAARAAGYDTFDLIEASPRRTYMTRTLGEITYRPRVCHVVVEPPAELPHQGTWGDFARSLSGS
jgi:hypothetical protein